MLRCRMHVMALALLLSSCSTEVARVGVGGPVEEGEVAATGSEVEFVDTPCFKLGYAWKPEYEGKPPECLDGLTVVPPDLQPFSRVFIGLGPETSGTTALLDALANDARVVPIGERDFFSWEQNFRHGIQSYLGSHRNVYRNLQEKDAKYKRRFLRRQKREQQRSEDENHRASGNGDIAISGHDGDADDADDDDDDDDDDENFSWTYEPLPPLEEIVFAEKSPLYGHHPLAAYRLHASLPHVGGGKLLRHQFHQQLQWSGRSSNAQDDRHSIAAWSSYAAGYPTAQYDRHSSTGGGGLVWTFRNPIVRACSRLKKVCPTRHQQLSRGAPLPGPGYDDGPTGRLARELRPLRDYKQCRAEHLWWVHLCNASAVHASPTFRGGDGSGRGNPEELVDAGGEDPQRGTVPALIKEHFRAVAQSEASTEEQRRLFDVCKSLPPPRVAADGREGWPFDDDGDDYDNAASSSSSSSSSPSSKGWTLEVAHSFERRMSRLLFESGFWNIREARVIEEEVFFECHLFFRKISYHIYPGMYSEHLRRYRFLFPDVQTTPKGSKLTNGDKGRASSSSFAAASSLPGPGTVKVGPILMSYQEDLLERPEATLRAVQDHLGLLPPLVGDDPQKADDQEESTSLPSPLPPPSTQQPKKKRRKPPRGSIRFAGGRHIDRDDISHPRERSGSEMAVARCSKSSVSPTDLLRVFRPSIAEFYDLVGHNYSWESAAAMPLSPVSCHDWSGGQ